MVDGAQWAAQARNGYGCWAIEALIKQLAQDRKLHIGVRQWFETDPCLDRVRVGVEYDKRASATSVESKREGYLRIGRAQFTAFAVVFKWQARRRDRWYWWGLANLARIIGPEYAAPFETQWQRRGRWWDRPLDWLALNIFRRRYRKLKWERR